METSKDYKKIGQYINRVSIYTIIQIQDLYEAQDTFLNALIQLILLQALKKKKNLAGYLFRKGWKVLTWFSNAHMDPEVYLNARKFDPSIWDVNYISHLALFVPNNVCFILNVCSKN